MLDVHILAPRLNVHSQQVPPPLPDCVPGEWGPKKASTLFGLEAVSHPFPVISAAPPSYLDFKNEIRPLTLNIGEECLIIFPFLIVKLDLKSANIKPFFVEFKKTKPVLDFFTILYKNGVSEKKLQQCARYRNEENFVIFDIKVKRSASKFF